MRLALDDAGLAPGIVDYVNAHAHATATPAGDRAELRALKTVFGTGAGSPAVSSTKSQTGHGLSLAGTMEAASCYLALREGFLPASLNVTEPDPEADSVRLVTTPTPAPGLETVLVELQRLRRGKRRRGAAAWKAVDKPPTASAAPGS